LTGWGRNDRPRRIPSAHFEIRDTMAIRPIRIIMDGVTGRLGTHQHLIRSILAIRSDGGLALKGGDRLLPEPILLGRNAAKLSSLAAEHGGLDWSTDADACLGDPRNDIYFDASLTAGRADRARRAIAAGKHVYLEKPIAETLEEALELARTADQADVKNGTVQDKLFLPGLLKLRHLRDTGFFGRILSARLEFGWWIFDGEPHPAQRSSWNYRKADGGGLILDMFPHWRYIVDRLIGDIRAVSCRLATRIPRRRDESGCPYAVDVEDEVFATFELDGGVLVDVNSSWCTRVRRDDMLTIQIDGTGGSAVCGLHRCFTQSLPETPLPRWNVEAPQTMVFAEQWQEGPEVTAYKNSYRAGWELFLRHVGDDAPFPSPLIEGAKGLQLVDACHRSHRERRWMDLPPLAPPPA
jgi:predicted dehydrogenase